MKTFKIQDQKLEIKEEEKKKLNIAYQWEIIYFVNDKKVDKKTFKKYKDYSSFNFEWEMKYFKGQVEDVIHLRNNLKFKYSSLLQENYKKIWKALK